MTKAKAHAELRNHLLRTVRGLNDVVIEDKSIKLIFEDGVKLDIGLKSHSMLDGSTDD